MTKLHKLRVALVAFVLAFVIAPTTIASAFVASAPPPVHADTTDVSTVVIAAPIATVIVSFVIPLINGLITTAGTPGWVKGVVTIILNAVWALFAAGTLADGSAAFSSTALFTAVLGVLISLASYAKVFKPMNATSNSGGKLANIGIH